MTLTHYRCKGRTIYLCRICGEPHDKKPNGFYCDACQEVLKQKGAYRFQIAPDVFVWVKGTIKRAVVNGKDVNPIRECYEVVE